MPRERNARRLVLASLALFAYWLVAAVIAITQDWPAEFDTTAADDPTTLPQWIVRGSLIHAPLLPIVVQVFFTSLAFLRRRGWIIAAAVGLFLVGCMYLIGYAGEPLGQPERSDPPVVIYNAIRLLGLGLTVTLVVVAALAAVRPIRR